jgi:hypothetical protein
MVGRVLLGRDIRNRKREGKGSIPGRRNSKSKGGE